ncbi:MAG TPA: type IIL restriction-modification enzyme MmeI, partial [Dehalococcoidia bacterium]|nr:type IIL restriction-modification enzyme MmeI [Dehalococcoidia bacterium]
LRLIANGIIAAGLKLGGKPGTALDNAYKALEWALIEAFPADGSEGNTTKLEQILDGGLAPTVETDYERWRPLHWVIEAPDVLLEHDGFDAIIGNPPFLGDKKLRGVLGDNFREYLVRTIGRNVRGGADFVAYFFLRAYDLIRRDAGGFGLIATNTIAQGDTREVGLQQLADGGITILRAIRSEPWPAASATLEFAAVWGTRAAVRGGVQRWLDGRVVKGITTGLDPVGQSSGHPRRLAANASLAFIGSYVLGKGFILDAENAQALLRTPANAKVVFPYLNGSDVNSNPDLSANRWVINFFDWPLDRAQQFPEPLERVERLVRPERAKVNRKANRERWWQYAETRPGLYRAIQSLSRVIVIARVSKTVMPALVPSGDVFSEQLVVFATDKHSDLAVLSSSAHQLWVLTYASTLGAGTRYTPSDVFETFPRPRPSPRVAAAGQQLDEERREIMMRRQLGLTALYTLVNSPAVTSDRDVTRLRELHVEVDAATVEAYSWTDLDLAHGFSSYRQMERFTVGPTAQVELLNRLLRENHRRAREEGQDVPEEPGDA